MSESTHGRSRELFVDALRQFAHEAGESRLTLIIGCLSAPIVVAVRWQRYPRGPVSGLHRACGADIVRGSLRLLSHAQRPAAGAR